MQGNTEQAREENGDHVGVERIHYLHRKYEKDATIRIETGFEKVTANDIIEAIENDFGENSVYACVPRGGFFEVTLCDIDTARHVADGLEIEGTTYNSRIVSDKTVVVSFLHLTPYIEDEQIINYLENLNITVLSPIKRHFLKDSKRKVTDGTRYVRVRFPSALKSLPYSVRFDTCDGPQPFKVLHNGQVRTCNQCFETDHVVANCPFVECRICREQGHIARNCENKRCPNCRENTKYCKCDLSETDEEVDKKDEFEGFSLNISSDKKENDWSLTKPVSSGNEQMDDECGDKEESDKMQEESTSVNAVNETASSDIEELDKERDKSKDSPKRDRTEKTDKKRVKKRERRARLVKRMDEDTVKNLTEERKRKTMNDSGNDLENKQKKANGEFRLHLKEGEKDHKLKNS